MSFNKIESAIITAKQITHWDFHLIEYNHTKNPNEYVCYNIPFASAQLLNDITSELMQLSWPSLIEHINNSDDSVDLKDISANAFAFVGNYEDTDGNNKNLYLLSRKNPVLTFKKRVPILSARNNTIKETTEPLVQFGKHF